MVDATGIEGANDVLTEETAAQLLEIEPGASDDDIQAAYRDAVLENHPDNNGDPEIFKAVEQAKDILDGILSPVELQQQRQQRGEDPTERDPNLNQTTAGGRSGGGTSTQDTSTQGTGTQGSQRDTGTASGPGFGGFGGASTQQTEGPDRDVLFDAILNLLRVNTTEEGLKDKYGPNATIENVANILTDMILAGGLELGDVKKMLNDEMEFGSNFGQATGGLFGGASGAGGIFGGGGGLGSSNPRDYMQWGADRQRSDEDDDQDD